MRGGERSIRAVKSMMTLRYVVMTGFLEKKTMKSFLSIKLQRTDSLTLF